jgi:hypothetical protein
MDNLTGFMWLRNANCIATNYPGFDNDYTYGDGRVTWQHALDFVKGINNGTYSNCGGGYSDWHLPNRKELLSLIDRSQFSPPLPIGHPFINQSYYYWSSTTNAPYYTHTAWFVVMTGFVNNDFKNDDGYYVWPVRSGTVGSFDYYCDNDGDGYIDSSIDGTCTGSGCVPTGCQTTAGDDCNDNDPTINPAATEICDGKDNDCDDSIDEGGLCDLLVSTWTAPANACASATISIKDTTKNQGTGTAGASTTKFYFSTNTTLDAGDTPLGSRVVPSLNPAAVSTGTTSVTLPNVSTGKYYLIAMADDGKVVSETNETNNKKSKAIYIGPDLIVSTLTAPTSAVRGTTISIGDTTKNKGCGTAGASTTKFYLSTNTTINIGVDYELGTRPVPSLGTNAVSTGTTGIVIPVGIPIGKYYIIANSDDANVVVEGNEGNNKKTKVITINP